MSEKVLRRIPLERLMDLKVDYAFKQLFGSEKNKEITVVFLNAILNKTGRDTIRDITFRNVEIAGEYENDKQSRLDILAITNENDWINVEIQFTNKYDMVKRTLFYWSKVYTSQSKKGVNYKSLRPVITINLLNFNLFENRGTFYSSFHLYEDIEKFRLTDVLEVHFIEFPKLIRNWKERKLDPWNDVFARWMLLLGIVDHREKNVYDDIYHELEAIAMKDEKLLEAFQRWEQLSLSDDEFLAYEGRLKQIMDDEAIISEAKMREEEALEKGRLEGRLEGKLEGIEIGKRDNQIEVVRNMLLMSFPIEQIANATGLSIEEIEIIKNNIT